MLDAFLIFTKGGIVLYSYPLVALRGDPVNALIQTCLLEERGSEATFEHTAGTTAYAVKFALHNELGLVFVAARRRRHRRHHRRQPLRSAASLRTACAAPQQPSAAPRSHSCTPPPPPSPLQPIPGRAGARDARSRSAPRRCTSACWR